MRAPSSLPAEHQQQQLYTPIPTHRKVVEQAEEAFYDLLNELHVLVLRAGV
jgi:hypothetical protein